MWFEMWFKLWFEMWFKLWVEMWVEMASFSCTCHPIGRPPGIMSLYWRAGRWKNTCPERVQTMMAIMLIVDAMVLLMMTTTMTMTMMMMMVVVQYGP